MFVYIRSLSLRTDGRCGVVGGDMLLERAAERTNHSMLTGWTRPWAEGAARTDFGVARRSPSAPPQHRRCRSEASTLTGRSGECVNESSLSASLIFEAPSAASAATFATSGEAAKIVHREKADSSSKTYF